MQRNRRWLLAKATNSNHIGRQCVASEQAGRSSPHGNEGATMSMSGTCTACMACTHVSDVKLTAAVVGYADAAHNFGVSVG